MLKKEYCSNGWLWIMLYVHKDIFYDSDDSNTIQWKLLILQKYNAWNFYTSIQIFGWKTFQN